jgi:gliding motility-associated-like protein
VKFFIGILLFLLWHQTCTAQGEANNWYFGVRAAISFNSGSPQPVFNSQMSTAEGCSSMSDRDGNLLFYSDGYFIWNRNHQRMTNNGLFSVIGDNSDGSQTGVIVPWPNNDSLYYVFSIGQLGGNLYYSVVNINRNGGLGEVINKKVLLQSGVCEKLTAVRHCNKRDYWVVSHKFNSDEYCSFIVNPTGPISTPVLSPTGNFIVNSNGMEFSNTMGYLKNSPDGRLLAAAHYVNDYVELTDFNTTTGVVSNPRKLYVRPQGVISPVFDGAYGIEFSHDSRVLYVSSHYGPPHNDTTALYQFDVTQTSEAAIQASRFFIYGADWSYNTLTALQLGPDRKIYVAKYGDYLSVINRPEILGSGCQFTVDALYIDDGNSQHHIDFGLPNFIQSYFNDPVIAIGNCEFSNISFSLQNLVGVSSVLWDFGDPSSGANNISTLLNPTHIFSQQGQYRLKAILYNSNGCGADTIYKIVHAGEFKVFLGGDTTLCKGDTLLLKMKVPNAGNLWDNGSRDTILSITQEGKYWVKVNLGECTASDTMNVALRQLPQFSLGNDTLVCANKTLLLGSSSGDANVSYLWNTGANSSSITITTPGTYWLRLKEDSYGCEFRDSINVQSKSLPNYNLGNDTALCEKQTLALTAAINGSNKYLWNTGETTTSIKVSQTNIYWADISKDDCIYRDSISVVFKPLPAVNLGNDTTLCEDEKLLLDAQNSNTKYLWQDHSINKTYLVTKGGNYWVSVTKDECSALDTVVVRYKIKPAFTLGKDKTICNGQTLLLQPNPINSNDISWQWTNGSNNPILSVAEKGKYILQGTNLCGSRFDTVEVYNGVCRIYIPTAFTPNNDGLNDVFKANFGEGISEFHLQVFNRWGQAIFDSRKINQGWNGYYRGIQQPVGTYIWIIHYKNIQENIQEELKGTVTLLQ